ncbi:MAG: alpha/beta fold hydrolase [Chloroflexi bacterium]|nr:alpha/beta fold hydrolase [Chloroflexota bacterium]
MPYISVRGVSLYYEQHGNPGAPRVLVAHGLMGSVAYANRLGQRADAFAERGFYVTAYDARGHGRSGYTTARADYRWGALAEDMHAFIDALGLAPVTVYGGSMGAGTALALALAHPRDVERLALLVPPPFAEDLPPVARTFGALATSYRLLGVPLTARIAEALARRRMQDPAAVAELRRFLGAQRRAAVVPAIRGLLLDGAQLPVEQFHEIQHPTIIFTQPEDPIHPLSSGEVLRCEVSKARLVVAPEPDYWNNHAVDLMDLITSFASGHDRGLGERDVLPGAELTRGVTATEHATLPFVTD